LSSQAAQQAAHEAQEALQQLEVQRAGRAKMAWVKSFANMAIDTNMQWHAHITYYVAVADL